MSYASPNPSDAELYDATFIAKLVGLNELLTGLLCPISEIEDDLLFHYTNVGTLTHVLSRGKLFASSLYYLNDPEEFRYSNTLIGKLVGRRRYIHLENCDSSGGMSGMFGVKYTPTNIFVSCFTTEKDSLPFWTAYADNGKGVSIGFYTSTLTSLPPWTLVKVIYDADQAKRVIIRFFDAIKLAISSCEFETQQRMIGDFFDSGLHLLCAAIKRDEYAHEKEWRLVYTSSPIRLGRYETKHRSNGKWIIPYTEIDIDIGHMAPAEVICGPLSYPTLIAPVVHQIQGRSYTYEGFVTKPSTVPYRG